MTTTLNDMIVKLQEIVKDNPSLGNNEVAVEYDHTISHTLVIIKEQTPIFKLFLN